MFMRNAVSFVNPRQIAAVEALSPAMIVTPKLDKHYFSALVINLGPNTVTLEPWQATSAGVYSKVGSLQLVLGPHSTKVFNFYLTGAYDRLKVYGYVSTVNVTTANGANDLVKIVLVDFNSIGGAAASAT